MHDDARPMSDILLELLAEVERTAPGLSLPQLTMLLHVVRNEGVRITDLACLCSATDASVSRNVRAMATAGEPGTLGAAHGLIELLRGADGRARHLAITPRGRQLTERLDAVFHGCFRDASAGATTSALVSGSDGSGTHLV